MTYAKVAYAAIQRYRIEKEFRQKLPKKSKKDDRIPFGVVMCILCSRGIITKAQRNHLQLKYKKLSKVLHTV